MGRNRFFYISQHIDVGKSELVQKTVGGKEISKRNGEPFMWVNLEKKIVPIIDKINAQRLVS